MNKNFLTIIFAMFLVAWAIFTISLYKGYTDLEGRLHQEPYQFIWSPENTDLPEEGSLIRIEHINENEVYIGPIE